MSVNRPRSMCLKLSDDEMDTLARIANQRGIPKVGVIRQWIQDASARQMAEPEELQRMLRAALRPKRR